MYGLIKKNRLRNVTVDGERIRWMVNGNDVIIRLADGKNYTIPKEKITDEKNIKPGHICEWASLNLLKYDKTDLSEEQYFNNIIPIGVYYAIVRTKIHGEIYNWYPEECIVKIFQNNDLANRYIKYKNSNLNNDDIISNIELEKEHSEYRNGYSIKEIPVF